MLEFTVLFSGIVILMVLRQCVFDEFCTDDKIIIKNCKNHKISHPWIQRHTNILVARFIDKCKRPGRIGFYWTIFKADHEPKQQIKDKRIQWEKSTLLIKPFVLSKGKYEIAVDAIHAPIMEPVAMSDICDVEVLAEKPIPVLTGGIERTVNSGTSFTMDGQKSRSMDAPDYVLQFSWECKVVEGGDKSFCEKKPIATTSVLVVPERYVKSGHTFKFTLSVKNSDSDWISTSQIVKVRNNVVLVNVVCRKNCPPHVQYTDVTITTYFEATCVGKCEKVGVQSYEWTLEGQQLDYEKDTEFGRHSARFVVKEKVLESGKKFKLRIVAKGSADRTGSAVGEFETKKPPSVKSCSMNPSSGVAFKTSFGVNCQYQGNGVKFKIYTAKKGSDKKVLLTTAADLNDLKFILPADNDVFINIIDDFGFTTESKCDVKVSSRPDEGETKVDTLKNAVDRLEQTENYEQSAQIMTSLLYEAKKESQSAQAVMETKKWIMKKLDKFPLDSEDHVNQIGALMAVMVDGDEKNPDPDVAEQSSKICKKLAEKQLQHALENPAEAKSSDAQQATKDLMSCVESNTQENAELLRPTDPVHVEPPYPPLPEEVITENYPDYVDDEKIAINTDKLDVAANNFVDICVLNAKSISATTFTGEGAVKASTKFCEVSVTKNTGDDLVNTVLEAKGVTVTPSLDFRNIENDVTSTMCVWTKNPFWWTSKDAKIITNVVLVKFHDQTVNYTTFQNPVIVSLEITEKIDEPKVHDIEFPTPGRYANEEDLSVVRIEVKRNESFSVQFHLEDFQTFRMVSSDFQKPTLKEVQDKGQLIDKASAIFYQKHDHDYNGWHYISMIPENEKTKEHSQYRISVFTYSCYTWNVSTRGWSFGCKGSAKSNSKRLECECFHLSVLAGVTYNNNIRVEKTVEFQYIMTLLTTYGILIATSVIFLVYCVLILFIRRKKEDIIYVLADVSRYSRYLYLIEVQTGAKLKSGTTSNVCIKVYGTRGESKEHVLNYPDPQSRILQRGQRNFFVLTNEYHLGDVTKIDLWFDCIGRQPAWFCESVTIHDAQTKESWYFEVNRWLSLYPHNEAYVTTNPKNDENVEKEETVTKRQACLRNSRKVAAVLCNRKSGLDSNVPLFARRSILLSVFVTIYGLVMIMYGMPIMHLRDGFTTFDLKFHWTIIVIPIFSALITFAVHATLIWLWELSKFPNKLPFWSFLAFNITFWMSLLVIFGFWMPLPKMWLWLIASALALLIYYLVFFTIHNNIRKTGQKTKNTAIAILNSTKDLIRIVEIQRLFLFKEFGEAVLRPYLGHLYQPLNEEEMKRKKQREEAKMKIIELLSDVVMFLVYISLLYLVVLANKDSLTIVSYQKMLELLSGEFTRSEDFNEVGSIEDTYDYLNNTLIPATQSLQWYGKFVVDDPGTMKDYDNKYIGVVRLRQHRVVEKRCKVPRLMDQFSSRCFPEFSTSCNDENPFGTGVSPHERMASVWNYTEWNKAGTVLTIGTISQYPGGGYVAPLGRTMTNSIVNLNYLHRKHWINPATRAVFIEFIAYNANANLFNAISILIEYSATGYVKATHDIKTAKLVFVQDESEIVEVVIFLAFVVTLVVFAIKLCYKLWYKRKFFFRDLWLVIDLMIVLLSFGCFVLFCYRITLVGRFLEAVEKAQKNEFINYFTLFRLETVLTFVAAFLVCIATIRLWKLLRFGMVFLVVEKTLLLSASQILALGLCQLIIFVAFALTAYVAFGDSSSAFKDYTSSIVTLVILSLNLPPRDFDIEVFARKHQSFGLIFYSVYMFLTLLIYTIYIVIICINYNIAQTEYSNLNNPVNVHVKNELSYFKNWLMVKINRLRGGNEQQELQHVTPKADEHRYADCTSISKNKLELMTLVVRNQLDQQLTNERKVKLMLSSASKYLQEESDEKERFFKVQDETNKFKLVQDDTIVKIEKVVEGLFGKTYEQPNTSNQNKRTANRHMRKLNYIEEVLTVISKIINNIKLEE